MVICIANTVVNFFSSEKINEHQYFNSSAKPSNDPYQVLLRTKTVTRSVIGIMMPRNKIQGSADSY